MFKDLIPAEAVRVIHNARRINEWRNKSELRAIEKEDIIIRITDFINDTNVDGDSKTFISFRTEHLTRKDNEEIANELKKLGFNVNASDYWVDLYSMAEPKYDTIDKIKLTNEQQPNTQHDSTLSSAD